MGMVTLRVPEIAGAATLDDLDVASLAPADVVVLDSAARLPGAPGDVTIVSGSVVIARGEVVDVEGEIGVRILSLA